MSRVRQEVASVIFQADARKANASMEALQEKANSLNDAITGVKQQIEALGNVAPDHQGLISYQQQLRKLNSDLKDVQKTMSDYMRGVKAADQLWQSYMRGDIEGLSLKAIKAGQNGLRKRMENLSPGNPDDQKTLRAYEEVIKEADLVVNKFKTDAAETIQILRDGGTVSEQAMKKARDGVKSLMETVEEGTQEYREFSQQYEYLAAKTIEFGEAQRRAKGEIVDANDARRAAVRLTREGAEAAAREREAQDAVITAQQKEIEQTRALRQEKEKEIEQTNSQMATNMRLADAAMAERRQMEDDYQASLGAIAAEKRQQAQQTAQQKRTAYEQETQAVNRLDGEVKKLTEDLHALSAEPVKPKVDTSEVDKMVEQLTQLRTGALSKYFDMEQMWSDLHKSPRSTRFESLGIGKGDQQKHDLLDVANNLYKFNDDFNKYGDPIDALAKKYKITREEVEALIEKMKESQLVLQKYDISYKNGNLSMTDNTVGWGAMGTRTRSDAEIRRSVYLKQLDAEKEAHEEDIKTYHRLKEAIEGTSDAQQQGTQANKSSVETIEAEIEAIKQETLAIEERRRQIDLEQAARREAYEIERKRLMENPGELNATEQEMFAIEKEFQRIGSSFKRKKTDVRTESLDKIEERFGIYSDLWGSGRQAFAKGLSNDELNAYKNRLYDKIQEGSVDTVKSELEKIKSLITEINQASKDSSIEGNPNLQLDSLKKLRSEYEKVLKVVGDLAERKDDNFFEWINEESSEAYKNMEALKNIPDETSRELDELESKEDTLRERRRNAMERLTEAKRKDKEATDASAASDEYQRKQAELTAKTEELAQAKQRQAKAEGEMNAAQQQANKAQDDANQKQVEAVQLSEKAAQAEREAATEQERHNEVLQRQDEKIAKLQNDYDALDDTLKKQEGELAAYDQKVAQSEQAIAEAERKKAQARELSAKDMRDAIAALEERNRTLNDGEKEWTDNERLIAQYNKRLEEMKQRSQELRGEVMSLSEAMQLVGEIGKEGFVSTPEQMQQATKAIEQQREATIKLIQEKHRAGEATDNERQLLTQLDGALAKIKTGYANADEVIQRFNLHLGEPKIETATQQTEKLAQTLDEKLAAATSAFDDNIRQAAEDVDRYEQEIKEAEQELANMEQELAELEKKHANSSWFRRHTDAYKREGRRIKDLHYDIEGGVDDTGFEWYGQKQRVEDAKGWKQNAQQLLDFYKQQKAAALGLNEAEEQVVQTEEKLQQTRRMTREELQQGIKILEEEAIAQDRSTVDGQKKWEQLRSVIDQMNQDLKESTGEWMSLADAEKLAEQAGENYYLSEGKSGFVASPEEIQKATQALERQREAVIKNIQQKKANKNATDEEKKALADEEKKLQDLTKKLRDLKFEQDNVNMSQEKMRMLMKQPAQAVSLDELRAAIKRADGELRRMEGSLGKNSKEYKAFAEQVKAAKNTLKDMEGAAKASASAWEKAVSRLKTYVGLYMGFNIFWQKVTGTAGDLMTLSDKMGEVRKTTGFTADEVGRLSDSLAELDTRTNLTNLMSISAKAGQLGLKTQEDVMGFTEAANKLMVALPEMGEEAATQMMKVALATGEVKKIQKEMDEGITEGSSATAVALERIGSTIDQLRANSAAAAPQITDFVKRVGAVGAQSGITIDQVAALGSTVDALGMRVEMSATALSRMIPAIKNNAFEVAKAIGMAPEALRDMFDEAGGGMNAMLAIFQHIKDSGMNADDIEKMMGMGGMQDIMKDLNQQGARAGIVFAGLSQNVDVLRQHLGIAHDAYEQNIAIQNEYEKMEETTAAKWERLTNKVEEMFVSDSMQSNLGWLIDWMRKLVDLISGPLNTAFWTLGMAVGSIKLGLTELPSKVGGVFEYLKDSAMKAAEDLQKAANATGEISEAAEGVEEAGDAVSSIGDALGEAKEAGEQAGEAMETATGAIEGMTGATKVSILSVKGLKTAWKGLDATMKTNILVMVAAMLYTVGKAIYNLISSIGAEEKALAEANQEADRAVEKLNVYWDHLNDTTKALDEATKATEGLTKGTKEATDAEVKLTKATDDHRNAIANINQNYGKYLGFMLTEYDRAELVAAAHNKIAAAIRREILMKRKQAAIEENEKEYEEDLSSDWGSIVEQMTKKNRMTGEQASKARLAFRKMLAKSYTTNANGELVASDELKKSLGDLYSDRASLEQMTALWMARHLQQNYGLSRDAIRDITGIDYYKSDYGTSKGKYIWTTSKEFLGNNLRGDYLSEYFEMQRKNAKTGNLYQEDLGATEEDLKEQTSEVITGLKTNIDVQIALLKTGELSAKELNDAYAELARSLEGINENIDDLEAAEQQETKQFVNGVLEQNKQYIDSNLLQKARDKIIQGFDAFDTLDTGENKNIWGTKLGADSTDWKNMTAEQLVNRRKQMKDFVNAIQTDTDVQSVLKEDAALKKAIEAGMSSDMRTVIEWYNTERLKIQDELHARHLTNTGDWMDPKKERGAKKQFRDEMDAYLHELDAYYTERKTRIEQARNDEEITEGEAWRRTIQNDNEWQTRRAELQKLYSRKQQEVTKEELDAILHIISERTGDSEAFVKAAIAKTNQFVDAIEKSGDKGAAIVHRWMSQVVLDTERSYLKAAQAIGKQMKFIEDTLAKERPYDGITKNLQDNLDKMGVLAAKYRRENEELARQGKEPKYSNEQITAQSYDEMAFYLRQAADAYSIDIDELLRRMVKEGMTATAEEISKSDMLKQAVMGQLRKTYQEVQDAEKKEASQIKKDVEIIWNDDARGIGGMSMKATFDKALAQLGMQQDSVSRANSLIGAGAASDNVASRLAMKQIEVQMRMQKAQYDMYRVQANQRMAALKAEAKEHQRIAELEKQAGHEAAAAEQRTKAMVALRDAENVRLSLGLTLAEETKKEEQQKAELLKIQEESQNRLYQSLREWADLLTSSIQGVMEASNAGNAEYYNERAKLDLTGKGGPGAGTYVVIDDAGTEDAKASYEYLDERAALERQHEIEQQNAIADAWKKLADDLNAKMNEQITDWMNSYLQNASIDANTDELQKLQTGLDASKMAEDANTNAVTGLTGAVSGLAAQMAQGINVNMPGTGGTQTGTTAVEAAGTDASSVLMPGNEVGFVPQWEMQAEAAEASAERQVAAIDKVKVALDSQFHKQEQGAKDANQKMTAGTQSAFAKMTAAANLYGIAYQAMTNDNLKAEQKFLMIGVQAAGQAAIAMLTTDLAKQTGENAAQLPGILGKLLNQMPYPAAMATFAIVTGLLGGLMGLGVSKIAKSKSEIAQATGAGASAGKLTTGMLNYAEGNVNAFTDPSSLTPGRQYNVDAADGKTYRARYMGKDAKTHITNGPEFHLVGEKGREAIIDAHTTRLMQTDDTGIWQAIQTLYNGGRVSGFSTRRGRGVRAFAEGNIGDFEEMGGGYDIATDSTGSGMSMEMAVSLQQSIDRQSDLLERALTDGIKGVFNVYGKGGLVDSYDTGKKTVSRHGERY